MSIAIKARKRKMRAKTLATDLKSGGKRYRLGLYLTNSNIHAFIYDIDLKSNICGVSSCSKVIKSLLNNIKPGTSAAAKITGETFKEIVNRSGIDKVDLFFNRSGYIFHGRVKAFYDGFFG